MRTKYIEVEIRRIPSNSGIKKRHNFSILVNFHYSINGNDSENHVESGDVKIFIEFPNHSYSKIHEIQPKYMCSIVTFIS